MDIVTVVIVIGVINTLSSLTVVITTVMLNLALNKLLAQSGKQAENQANLNRILVDERRTRQNSVKVNRGIKSPPLQYSPSDRRRSG